MKTSKTIWRLSYDFPMFNIARNNNPNRLNDEEYKLRKLALENKAKSRNFQDIKIDERVESIIKSTKNQNEEDSKLYDISSFSYPLVRYRFNDL